MLITCFFSILLHSEWSKLHRVLAILRAIGLKLYDKKNCTSMKVINFTAYTIIKIKHTKNNLIKKLKPQIINLQKFV